MEKKLGSGFKLLALSILCLILTFFGISPVYAAGSSQTIAVKVVFDIEDKVVPDSNINEDSQEFLKADYTTKIVAADGSSETQALIDKSGAKLVLMSGALRNPLTFSGIATDAYDFSAAIPALLNQYYIEYDASKTGGKTLSYWYEDERQPQDGVDFSANTPAFINNSNASSLSNSEQNALIAQTENYIQECLAYRLPANTSGHDAVFGTNGQTYGSWLIFTAARAGYTPHSGFAEECIAAFEEKYSQSGKVDSSGQPLNEGFDANEVAKDVLAITAIGYDARDVGGYNLIEMLTNGKNPSEGYFVDQVSQLALSSANYLPDRDLSYIHELAANALSGSVSHSDPLIDMYVMEFQPIAAYYDPNAKSGDEFYDVKQAMETVLLPYFSRIQGYTGLFYSGIDYNNAWSNAQSFIMLGMSGVNLFDEDYIKNGYSMFDLLPDKTLSFSADEGQIARGYEALVRSYKGENQLFDCSDVASTVPITTAILALPDADAINSANKATVEAQIAEIDALNTQTALSNAQKSTIDWAAYTAAVEKVKTVADEDPADDDPADETPTVTFSVEKFSLGQGYYMEPVEVAIESGDTGITLLNRVMGEGSLLWKSNYLVGIYGAQEGTVSVPEAISNMPSHPDFGPAPTTESALSEGLIDASRLSEKDYSPMSGWMYSVNNDFPGYGFDGYTPKDGDVIRVQFTLWGYGADLGEDFEGGMAPINTANKTELTRLLGEINSSGKKAVYLQDSDFKSAYETALTMMQNFEATAKSVNEAYENLKASISAVDDPESVSCTYRTHVQNVGWQNWVSDGAMSGTSGQGLRLEGIEIKLDTTADLGIRYKTHVQNIGWQDWVSNGNMSGTEGLSYRLEAIQIELTGADADKYDVYYQVHVQNVGWMGWAKNGGQSGTAGFGYRLEGIHIVVVPKGQAAPGSTDNAFISQ
ncbi:MAG: hypothetical protein PWP30_617 [Eubacteriaceae bacterium]|nr:hypothetical protein [Eubacteriaceae bacterium]